MARVLGIDEIPSDTQRRASLDGAPPEPWRRMLPKTCAQLRGVGGTGQSVTAGAGEQDEPGAVDGSAYCQATQSPGPGW